MKDIVSENNDIDNAVESSTLRMTSVSFRV